MGRGAAAGTSVSSPGCLESRCPQAINSCHLLYFCAPPPHPRAHFSIDGYNAGSNQDRNLLARVTSDVRKGDRRVRVRIGTGTQHSVMAS